MLVLGCGVVSGQQARVNCSELITTFFRKPPKVQIADFTTYSLDDQYEIYICGSQRVHPPAMHLTQVFASRGQAAVALLKTKLLGAQDDRTIRDVIAVFVEMNRQGTYAVARDSDLVRLMAESVQRIKDPDWRRITERMLREVQG
jgi:hypothetical protein